MKPFIQFVVLIFVGLLLPLTSCAPSKTANSTPFAEFPKDYIGNWSGTLQIYNGKGKLKEVPMQLIVQPLKDSAGTQYSWQIIYGDLKNDNRPYRLVPVDAAKGHWLIDENDGIQLHAFYLGGSLFNQFVVEGNLLTSIERVEGGKMYYEIVSAKTAPLITSGGSKESPPVDSYNIVATQKAVLTRKK